MAEPSGVLGVAPLGAFELGADALVGLEYPGVLGLGMLGGFELGGFGILTSVQAPVAPTPGGGGVYGYAEKPSPPLPERHIHAVARADLYFEASATSKTWGDVDTVEEVELIASLPDVLDLIDLIDAMGDREDTLFAKM